MKYYLYWDGKASRLFGYGYEVFDTNEEANHWFAAKWAYHGDDDGDRVLTDFLFDEFCCAQGPRNRLTRRDIESVRTVAVAKGYTVKETYGE